MSDKFNVLLLGAGPVNFGTTEGPWNHTKRLEEILCERLNIVGLVERDNDRADQVLTIKRANPNIQSGYAHTKVFNTLDEAGSVLAADGNMPKLIIDGFQPVLRGSTQPGRNMEMQLIKLFPDAALFIEKPISSSEFTEVDKVKKILEGRIISVGYMLRYLKAAREMKKLIDENGLQVMMTMATYFFAYEYASDKVYANKSGRYWDKSAEMGLDLTRFLSNSPPIPESIHVHTVEHSDPVGKLSILQFDENDLVPEGRRLPRITNATWRTENGGTASFVHGIFLHEGDYDCELVILADGWKLKLVDPYGVSPRLYVRKPGSGEEVMTVFNNDDCYRSELEAIINVIDGKADRSSILSSYADAVESYKLTWQIRLAGEREYKARGGNPEITDIEGV